MSCHGIKLIREKCCARSAVLAAWSKHTSTIGRAQAIALTNGTLFRAFWQGQKQRGRASWYSLSHFAYSSDTPCASSPPQCWCHTDCHAVATEQFSTHCFGGGPLPRCGADTMQMICIRGTDARITEVARCKKRTVHSSSSPVPAGTTTEDSCKVADRKPNDSERVFTHGTHAAQSCDAERPERAPIA